MLSNEEVLALISAGHFKPTMHAVTRMDAREVREDDVRSVARTAVECRWQEANATWRLTGQSAEGDRLVVVLGAHATGLRLVTV